MKKFYSLTNIVIFKMFLFQIKLSKQWGEKNHTYLKISFSSLSVFHFYFRHLEILFSWSVILFALLGGGGGEALFQMTKLSLVILKMLHLKILMILQCLQNAQDPSISAKYSLFHDGFRMNQHLWLKKYFAENFLTRSTASIPVWGEIINWKHELWDSSYDSHWDCLSPVGISNFCRPGVSSSPRHRLPT